MIFGVNGLVKVFRQPIQDVVKGGQVGTDHFKPAFEGAVNACVIIRAALNQGDKGFRFFQFGGGVFQNANVIVHDFHPFCRGYGPRRAIMPESWGRGRVRLHRLYGTWDGLCG